MIVSFCYWNIRENPLIVPSIINVVQNRGIDILVISEATIDIVTRLETELIQVNSNYKRNQSYLGNDVSKVEFFSTFSDADFFPKSHLTDRLFARSLNVSGIAINVIGLHLISKQNSNRESQILEADRISRLIATFEDSEMNHKTIAFGDFNMNPFEVGMTAPHCFHAVPHRTTAKRRRRTYQDATYSYFYNPMWRFLGDPNETRFGTYYLSNPDPAELHWNTLDQVIIRPDALALFDPNSLEILISDGVNALVDRHKRPDRRDHSDHLPIVFRLNL